MEVQPNKQNIKEVFSGTVYYIDFYQRQYKWNSEPVKKLLDDIFYKFNIEHSRFKDDNRELKDIMNQYGWYYLNTFVTNQIGSKTYVVDGQQRLTTLSLILMKLRQMAFQRDSLRAKFLDSKITGIGEYGQYYWMNHENQTETLQDIYDNGKDAVAHDDSVTAKNLVENYKVIDSRLEYYLPNDDNRRFEAFVSYFLNRVVLIQLDIQQADVPMVFEVINDRGVRLKPYEILKGKLLGQLSKEELDALNLSEKWDRCMEQLGSLDFYKTDERNEFFITYLRAKFADSHNDGKKIDAETYHRYIMDREELHLEHNAKGVLDFLTQDLQYYTSLYYKIRKCRFHPDTEYKYLYYLSLNDQNRVLMLILSACKLNDSEEEEKIRAISYEFDRLYSLLQLQRAYNGNEMENYIYTISKQLRESEVSSIHDIFNTQLIEILRKSSGNNGIENCWNYSLFRNIGYDSIDRRFLRYAFARVELHICKNSNVEMRHPIKDLVQSRSITFHIEHILANNEENRALFDNEETFVNERNRMGDLLLLKGKDNQSAGNESYSEKLKTYSNTLYWNETLLSDTYIHNLDFTNWIKESGLKFRAYDTFGAREVEERQSLLFEIFNQIWNNKE